MKDRTWFSMNALSETEADISIYDEIGFWGVTAKDFRTGLKALGNVERINLTINSPGGDVLDGFAIYEMLRAHGADIHVKVEGVAASMASTIAMVGTTLTMPSNAYLMIHNPWGIYAGESDELRSYADLLDNMKGRLVAAYRKRFNKSDEEISAMMDETTWLNGEEAFELGIVDELSDALEMAARLDPARLGEESIPENARGWFRGEQEVLNADVETPADEADSTDSITAYADDPVPVNDAQRERERAEIYDAGYDAGVKETERGFQAQINDLNNQAAEREQSLQEQIADRDQSIAAIQSELDEEKAKRGRLLAGLRPTEDDPHDPEITTFEHARDALGYEQARKQYPTLYTAYLNDLRKKKRK